MLSQYLSLAPDVFLENAKTYVITLTDENFDQNIVGKNFLIKFFAPWCKHCKMLGPVFFELGEVLRMRSSYHVGTVDCTTEYELCRRFEIHGYPTMVHVTQDGLSRRYMRGRDAPVMASYLADKSMHALGSPIPAPRSADSFYDAGLDRTSDNPEASSEFLVLSCFLHESVLTMYSGLFRPADIFARGSSRHLCFPCVFCGLCGCVFYW